MKIKKIIFVSNIEKNNASGISKKIDGQCQALSNQSECILLCKQQNKIIKIRYIDGKLASSNFVRTSSNIQNLLGAANDLIDHEKFDILYFRLTLKPSVKQFFLFKKAYNLGIKIFYEIPTYPYFFEQLHESKRKLLSFFKLVYDYLIFKLVFKYIYRIPSMISNSEINIDNKFMPIHNGVSIKTLKISGKVWHKSDPLNFIGVGTLYSYHGYERLIKAIYKFQKENKYIKLYFHIVGNGPELENLKKVVSKFKLNKYVIFHGTVFGEDLDNLYEKADIGVGALSLNKRNADIDTTLKLVEYLTRGLPVVTSGSVPYLNNDKFIFKVSNDDVDINLKRIVDSFMCNNTSKNIYEINQIRYKLDWNTIMRDIIHENSR